MHVQQRHREQDLRPRMGEAPGQRRIQADGQHCCPIVRMPSRCPYLDIKGTDRVQAPAKLPIAAHHQETRLLAPKLQLQVIYNKQTGPDGIERIESGPWQEETPEQPGVLLVD